MSLTHRGPHTIHFRATLPHDDAQGEGARGDGCFSKPLRHTNDEGTPVQTRLVHVVGAFQRSLDVENTNADELAAKFFAAWRHSRHLGRGEEDPAGFSRG